MLITGACTSLEGVKIAKDRDYRIGLLGKDMKKVIFVSGAEFSGTTFLHMILANDPHGLAVGEAHNMMRPSRQYHFNMHCSCGEHPCSTWQHLRSIGEERLYQSIFEIFPEVDFVLDSSGDPFWIRDQTNYLKRQGIAVQDFVIWKSPYEFAQSHYKRGSLEAWEGSWTTYHRLYYTLFNRWPAMAYSRIVRDRDLLRALCDYLEIEDYEGKESFWERQQHVVGGNPSARVHLYPPNSAHFKENVQRSSSKVDVIQDGTYRRIYEGTDVNPSVIKNVDVTMKRNPRIQAILALLDERDLSKGRYEVSSYERELMMPIPFVQLRLVKYWLVRRMAALRYGRNRK